MVDILLPVSGAVLLVLIVGVGLRYGMSAPPWIPIWQKDLKRMLSLADVRAGETVIDLGSGDGRVVLAAARDFGAQAIGVEASPLWVLLSRWRLRQYRKTSRILFGDLFAANCSTADVLILFLNPRTLVRVAEKLVPTLKPSARLVSYAFPFAQISPTAVSRPEPPDTPIYLYQIPLN